MNYYRIFSVQNDELYCFFVSIRNEYDACNLQSKKNRSFQTFLGEWRL